MHENRGNISFSVRMCLIIIWLGAREIRMEYKKGERVKHSTKEGWGLGEVISDRNEEFVTVLFVGAGEKNSH